MKNITLGNKGQLSLEYILSSMIVILIISLISIPILLTAMDYSNDIIDSINAKSELSKITDAIDFCYASGKGHRLLLIDGTVVDGDIDNLLPHPRPLSCRCCSCQGHETGRSQAKGSQKAQDFLVQSNPSFLHVSRETKSVSFLTSFPLLYSIIRWKNFLL